jgi:hypothetical protein
MEQASLQLCHTTKGLTNQNFRNERRNEMPTIKDYQGKEQRLSEEIYEITAKGGPYKKGTRVRLISGVDGKRTPGYHFVAGYVTVCKIDVKIAQFCGVRRRDLKMVV